MDPSRRAAAEELMGGPLPLQASLRRLLRQIVAAEKALVAPANLGWPEALLRPYLAYLEDLGLLVPIGPLVEVTPRGRAVAAGPDTAADWPPVPVAAADMPAPEPDVHSALFRYFVVRRVCLAMVAMRGRREWHLLQPLLDGPLAVLAPAYTEWASRFLAAQPTVRRSWGPELVEAFEARRPEPPWFAEWCQALFGVAPAWLVQSAAAAPGFLREPAVLAAGPLDRGAWAMATAVSRATARGWAMRYAEAGARLAKDGVVLPHWPAMQDALESAGLLVSGHPDVRLLYPVDVEPPAEALWPYAGPEWLAAALLEGGAYGMPGPGRRPMRGA
jgi:hypothetical protein